MKRKNKSFLQNSIGLLFKGCSVITLISGIVGITQWSITVSDNSIPYKAFLLIIISAFLAVSSIIIVEGE